ncbi:hypothetical protein [Actinokineospora cianjurensis]|uniref:Uncharacterized protein n=1 Tax=Actinokineospora cianjurensis TaxID=585224 RepID=A0A421BA75_9PSEU|nr:hypothetical protein [Actinokineospora cianjurensis]RLK61185.1 hypothetical protein CLV68_1702 [Actinokineospora cianjurensis]
MRSRHLPLPLWLRHPVVAANATFLARGTENGELAHEARGLGRAGRLVHRRSRRLGRWSKRACSAAAASTANRACARAAADTTRVLGFSYHTTAARGWAISATEARPLLVATLRTIDEEVSAGVTTHHQSRSRLITAIAYLLLAVDAVALFTVFALLLNLDGSPLTRRAATLTRVITRADAEHHRHLRRAHRHLTRARRLTARIHHEHDRALARAARYYLPAHRTILLSRSLTDPSPDHPPGPTTPGTGLAIRLPVDRTPLTTPLEQARAAVAGAEAEAGSWRLAGERPREHAEQQIGEMPEQPSAA